MELGADAVLRTQRLLLAQDPVQMGAAFKLAVAAGRMAYEAGQAPSLQAQASSPLTEFLNED